MLWLTGFELRRIWCRRSFLLGFGALLVLNVFLLWYANLPGEEKPGLSSYKTVQREIAGMSEPEKGEWIHERKETMDGVTLVQEVLMLQAGDHEMGEMFAEQALEAAPGVFERYYDTYQNGTYLEWTDSFWQERALTDELYEEWIKTAGYGEYLRSVQENQNILGGIGIFAGEGEESFSSRNIRKSAADYEKLTPEGISWMPGRAVTHSMENMGTDLIMLLSVFFFVGYLILEEKRKGLFFITRSTREGLCRNIAAKLTALMSHCMLTAFLLYGVNLLYFGLAVGFRDLNAPLQSVAAYRESSLPVSILEYIGLSILTKGFVLFGFGAVLTAFSVMAERQALPYMAGMLIVGVSYLLYRIVPAVSNYNPLKYMNLTGLLKTEHLYGGYLNFNWFGRPVSRLSLAWMTIFILAAAGITAGIRLFVRGENFYLKKRRFLSLWPFRPHAGLPRHEGYKILTGNRAAIILLAFGILIGWRELGQKLPVGVQEQYYQDIMLTLEGEINSEKEELILAEEARYQEAFAQIQKIDEAVDAGELNENAGESMKIKWYAVTAFYPAFSRVWQQYQYITENGGRFLYDTGYLYLLGQKNNPFTVNLLLLVCGVIMAFGNGMSMENLAGAWNLLGATRRGKSSIIIGKTTVCVTASAIFALVPFAGRFYSVRGVFPMHGLAFSAADIPYCRQFGLALPVWGLLALHILSQMLTLTVVAIGVLLISYWRKEPVQTWLFGVLLFAVPLALKLLGFSAAEAFSLYPFYAWTGA
ncbi:hypothetical protein [Acetatifactor muris]|uniref:hypothetical protein n=1 Tax=Acetatifactor muris TaxID=879566 RepID=UPI0023F23555|nr:hypothetical protein [Acetatifactor muris]